MSFTQARELAILIRGGVWLVVLVCIALLAVTAVAVALVAIIF